MAAGSRWVSVAVLRRPHLWALLFAWLGYFILLATLGLPSAYDKLGQALLYQVIFIALVAAPLVLLPVPHTRSEGADRTQLTAAIVIGFLLSIAAIIFILVDRAIIGVDYSRGLCYARNQMTQLGEQRQGVSSPFSVLGNLLSSSFFVPLGIVLTQRVSRRTAYIAILLAYLCLMAVSTVLSSRSIILITVAFVVGMLCVRVLIGRGLPRPAWSDLAFVLVLAAGAGLFVLSVFECRATASGLSATEYRDDFAPYLGTGTAAQSTVAEGADLAEPEIAEEPASTLGTQPNSQPEVSPEREVTVTASSEEREDRQTLTDGVSEQAAGLFGMAALYIVHSAYTFDGILSLPPTGGRVMFTYPQQLLARAGLAPPPPDDWVLAGRFSSVPGGLYHDFGFFGMCIGSILIGLMGWLAAALTRLFPTNIVVIGGAAASFAILVLSPMHFAAEFLAFPFICFAFLLVPALAWLVAAARGRSVGKIASS